MSDTPETEREWRDTENMRPDPRSKRMLHHARKLERERNVFKHNVEILADELESENTKAIDWFIHSHELKEALREALQWIDDGDDQKGRDLIVRPLRAKFFYSKD